MARIKGVDIPNDKHICISLTYIYGIGRSLAKKICKNAKVDPTKKAGDLTQDELAKILNITRSSISKYEHGINLALTSYIMGFCKYFHISADFVTGRIDEEIVLDAKINS